MSYELFALIVIGLISIVIGISHLWLQTKNKVLSASLRSAKYDEGMWERWSKSDRKELRREWAKSSALRMENEELRARAMTEKALADTACLHAVELGTKCQELSAENEELARDVDQLSKEADHLEVELQSEIDRHSQTTSDLEATLKTKDFLYAQVRRASKPPSTGGFGVFAGPQEASKPASIPAQELKYFIVSGPGEEEEPE